MRKILPWVSINNRIVSQEKAIISVLDDGFMFGYGFFTTLKVREGIPLFLDKHLLRLQSSATYLGVQHVEPLHQIPFDIQKKVQEVIKRNEMSDGAIRITITKGISDTPTVMIHATNIDTEIHTVRVIAVLDERDVFKTIKMTYRVPHLLAMQQAQEQGAQDALFSLDGFLIESTYANIYSLTDDQKIITPPIAGKALESISRKILLQQLPIEEQETREDTENPMVLVSSLSIRVVEKINGRTIKQNAAFVSKIHSAIDTAEKEYITFA